jgi:hypothetical protein
VSRKAVLAICAAALVLTPATAHAAKVHFAGTIRNDPAGSVGFDVFGKRTKKGFVPRSIAALTVTTSYSCFKPGNNTTTLRSDLFSQIGPMRVSRKGLFSGQHVPPATSDPHSYFSGEFAPRKGTFSGTFFAYEGIGGQPNYCATYQEIVWGAKPTSRLH